MRRAVVVSLAVAACGLASLGNAEGRARRYLVISKNQSSVSASVLSQVRAARGQVLKDWSAMGLLAVSSDNPDFARSVPAALAVAPDTRVQTARPLIQLGPDVDAARVAGPPDSGDDDRYFNLQWGITAVDAQNAWAQGRRGEGAIVAVLDEGVDATHPDLAPAVRADLSTSFAEGCDGTLENWQPEPGFYFNHGTHVAGIVAAADNAFGVIGVAPKAQIMAVSVLSRCLGYGLDSWIIDGIRYAADHGADVINMSLGSGPINTQGACDSGGSCYTAEEIKNLRLAYAYVAIYANLKGATVIASSGNDGFDFGASPEFIHLPSDTPGILSISATAPIGWGVDSTTDLDVPTYYSNFGKNRIDFAAPGGTDEYYYTDPNGVCVVAGVAQYCWVLDYVFSTIPSGWAWAAGTSMAAPHAAGVAAQLIGAAGGELSPLVVKALLLAWADHPNGNHRRDPFFGYGRVDSTLFDPRH